MAVVKDLIRANEDGVISFGAYTLAKKAKLDKF